MDAKNMPAIHGKTSLFVEMTVSIQSLPMRHGVLVLTPQRFIARIGKEGRQFHGCDVSIAIRHVGPPEMAIQRALIRSVFRAEWHCLGPSEQRRPE
jgi:hypothetical protein